MTRTIKRENDNKEWQKTKKGCTTKSVEGTSCIVDNQESESKPLQYQETYEQVNW